MEIKVGSAKKPKFMNYKVAAINYDVQIYRKEENIEKQYAMAEEAAKNGAKLIAIPEMGTTGYCWYNREEVKPFVEPIPGPTTEKFRALAKEYDCYIAVSMPEVDPKTNVYYNSIALVGPDGIVGVHRKTHLYIAEPKWAKQGDLDHVVFETPIGNIGMLICMDIHFVETARIQGLRNADVIIHVSNWLAEKTPAPYWLTRAFDNGCYVLEANRAGLERTVEFAGGSVLINPDGTIDSYVDEGNQIMYGTVDIEKARSKKFANGGNKYLERRPKEYMEIMQNSYLWNPLDFFGLYGQDPLPKGKQSKITVAQVRPAIGNVALNMAMIKRKVEAAAADASELIVFPELTLTGLVETQEAKKLAEEIPGGKFVDTLIDLSMKHKIYIVAGMPEKDGDKYYNTAVLTGPEGLVGKYRKMHLCELDNGWAEKGDLGFPHFNTPVGRIGLLIGHDAMFPESGRMLALSGVDLICCPSAVNSPKPYGLSGTREWHNYPIPRGYSTIHWHLWRVRGGENNCYMAFANQTGEYISGDPCIGRSGIFGPDTFLFPRQEVILTEKDEETASFVIDTSNSQDSIYPTNVVRRKDLICMRQPLWYDVIVEEKPPVLDLFK